MANIDVLANLIKNARNSIVTSVDRNGCPHTKALLAPRKTESIKSLYFSTNYSSQKVSMYLENPKACVYFFDGAAFKGLLLTGTMEVMQDAATRVMVWHDGDELYYPIGVSDPDYCVLKFTAQHGRYYSNFKSEDFDI